MNVYIQQSIQINSLRVGGITNSSVLQIGSAGMIKPASYLYNTGGFTGPAPATIKPDELAGQTAVHSFGTPPPSLTEQPSVPLQAPVRSRDRNQS
ncbi:spore germination protein GerPB [Neobacillus muris]|uniref:spore germination protein GerPB n=1 Tax=Neobacillus muris TaxID=2941334 RepID=UPI0020410C86|nr:spore germination protein GerPB [Neobacillus muris]